MKTKLKNKLAIGAFAVAMGGFCTYQVMADACNTDEFGVCGADTCSSSTSWPSTTYITTAGENLWTVTIPSSSSSQGGSCEQTVRTCNCVY